MFFILILLTQLNINQLTSIETGSIIWQINKKLVSEKNETYNNFNRKNIDYDSGIATIEIQIKNNIIKNVYYYNNCSENILDTKKSVGLLTDSLSFILCKNLVNKFHSPQLLPVLAIHNSYKNEAFNLMLELYKKASTKEQIEYVYAFGLIKHEKSLPFLNTEYDNGNSEKRNKIVFAYYLLEDNGSVELLKVLKKENESEIKKSAIFWLSQLAGDKMSIVFNEILYSDEDIEVKKSVVFACYQKKNSDLLKQIALNSKDIRLRKDAIFWLGRLDDGNIDFLTSLINKN